MPTSDWAPTVADVGAILRARTKDTNGVELGTFTADTRPTGTAVIALADLAVSDLVAEIGPDIPTELVPSARYLAALGTALMVELSYFPEDVAAGRSPYAELKALYDQRLVRLTDAVEDATGEGGTGGSPSYGFPVNAGGLVGWGTEF